jgi:hypothetical protein
MMEMGTGGCDAPEADGVCWDFIFGLSFSFL